jgi:sodium-dependent dicarboxylate transporter 2/3/5
MRSEAPGQSFPTTKVIGFISGILLFILFLANPFGMPLKAAGVAAVASMMASFWISVCIPIPVTSLLPIALFPLLGVMGSKQTVKYFSNDNIYLFMGGFIIALALEKWGLHKRIALVIALFIGTSPRKLVLGFLCATALISMLISNTATTMMMLPIAMGIISQTFELSGKRDNNFAVALMLAVAYGASIGGIATPIGTPPNIEFLGQFRNAFPNAPTITFFDWGKVFLPMVVVFIPLVWLILTSVVARTTLKTTAGRDVIIGELRAMGRIRKSELRVLIIFGITVLLWVFRQPINLEVITIPGWSMLLPSQNLLSDATVAIAMAILLFFIPSGEKPANGSGKKSNNGFLMNWETALRLPWGILILFGGGFAIAGGFQQSGLDILIGRSIKPLLDIHPLLMIGIICLLITFLTELTSNTATTAALLPVMRGTALALGVNPLLLMIPATISASCAFMLPVATPPNAIVFGSGYVPMSKMIKGGIILNILGVIIITLIVYFFVLPIWGASMEIPIWAH